MSERISRTERPANDNLSAEAEVFNLTPLQRTQAVRMVDLWKQLRAEIEIPGIPYIEEHLKSAHDMSLLTELLVQWDAVLPISYEGERSREQLQELEIRFLALGQVICERYPTLFATNQ